MSENVDTYDSLYQDISNPLDTIEDVLACQDWAFARPNPEELTVQVSGRQGQYWMGFLWQEDMSALQFFCEMDLHLPRFRRELISRALRKINEDLWVGHFDVPESTGIPCFRHTSLMRGWTQATGTDAMQDLVDIAIETCERYHHIFVMLTAPNDLSPDLLDLGLSETDGEA